MDNLAEILEQELSLAIEVKDKQSMHRYAVILAENIVQRSVYEKNLLEIKSEIKLLTETMKLGFEAIDKRFEAVDKRFEDMNKRFTMMFTFMNIGFGIIILITILVKFLQ